MNRRKLMKSLFGIGLIGAITPTLTKAQDKVMGLPPSPPTYVPDERPEDLRTPEQLFEDEGKYDLKWICDDMTESNCRTHKFLSRYHPSVYRKIKTRLIEQQKPFKIIDLGGDEAIVLYGNVITTF